MAFQKFTGNLLRFRNQDLKQKVVTASTLLGAEMGHLIFVGVLTVVFGGTAMALHLLAELKVTEVVLWTLTLVLFLIFQFLLQKS